MGTGADWAALWLLADPALTLLAPIPRARHAELGQQTDPRSERPAGAAWAAVGRRRQFLFSLVFLVWFGAHAGARAFGANERDVAAAAPAALDRISYGVDFDTTPIETALNWGALALARATGGTERLAVSTRR